MVPEQLPAWLTQEDLDFYVQEITASGFSGGFNWYRNIKRIPGLLAPFAGARDQTTVAVFVRRVRFDSGQHAGEYIQTLQESLPDLRGCLKFEVPVTGCSRSAPSRLMRRC